MPFDAIGQCTFGHHLGLFVVAALGRRVGRHRSESTIRYVFPRRVRRGAG